MECGPQEKQGERERGGSVWVGAPHEHDELGGASLSLQYMINVIQIPNNKSLTQVIFDPVNEVC